MIRQNRLYYQVNRPSGDGNKLIPALERSIKVHRCFKPGLDRQGRKKDNLDLASFVPRRFATAEAMRAAQIKVPLGLLGVGGKEEDLRKHPFFSKDSFYCVTMRYLQATLDEAKDMTNGLPEPKRNLSAIVLPYHPVQMFFDLDHEIKEHTPSEFKNMHNDSGRAKRDLCKAAFFRVLRLCFKKDFGREINLTDYQWVQACTPGKISFHFHLLSEAFQEVSDHANWLKLSFMPFIEYLAGYRKGFGASNDLRRGMPVILANGTHGRVQSIGKHFVKIRDSTGRIWTSFPNCVRSDDSSSTDHDIDRDIEEEKEDHTIQADEATEVEQTEEIDPDDQEAARWLCFLQPVANQPDKIIHLIDDRVYNCNRLFRLAEHCKPNKAILQWEPHQWSSYLASSSSLATQDSKYKQDKKEKKPDQANLLFRGLISYAFSVAEDYKFLTWYGRELPGGQKRESAAARTRRTNSSASLPINEGGGSTDWLRRVKIPWFTERKLPQPEIKSIKISSKTGLPFVQYPPGTTICVACTTNQNGVHKMHSRNHSSLTINLHTEGSFCLFCLLDVLHKSCKNK